MAEILSDGRGIEALKSAETKDLCRSFPRICAGSLGGAARMNRRTAIKAALSGALAAVMLDVAALLEPAAKVLPEVVERDFNTMYTAVVKAWCGDGAMDAIFSHARIYGYDSESGGVPTP